MELGSLVATRKIDALMQENLQFKDDVNAALNKYMQNDWGDTCKEDAIDNDESLVNGERVLAVYETSEGKIWIITEWDRSVTTILFPDEY